MQNDNAVIKVFSNEMEAAMAQQVLENAGIRAFVFKDDAGGMEPQLQLTNGVRLIVAHADAERALQIVEEFDMAEPIYDLPPE
jgi:hypothetical protein